jgi:hypothetical protein
MIVEISTAISATWMSTVVAPTTVMTRLLGTTKGWSALLEEIRRDPPAHVRGAGSRLVKSVLIFSS